MSVRLIDNAQQKKKVGTPASSTSSEYVLEYYKSDNNLYKKTSTGKELRIEGNGSKIFLSQTLV